MCGRYANFKSKKELETHFHVESDNESLFTPNFNVAPGSVNPVFLQPKPDKKGIGSLRWGLVPEWATDPAIGFKMINARSETLSEKPSFSKAFQQRRCLIPCNGFYEWKKDKSSKQPYFIECEDEPIMTFAGLYAMWRKPSTKELIWTYTIITTEANEKLMPIHDRIPVILKPNQFDEWLDPTNTKTLQLQRFFQAYPSELIRMTAVSERVNSTRNNDASLVEPAQLF